MKRQRQGELWLAAAIVLALIVRLLGVPAYALPSDGSPSVDWPFGPLVICTSEGVKVVDESGESAPVSPHAPCTFCPNLCLLGLLALLGALLLVPIAGPAARRPRPCDAQPTGPGGALGFRCRAPPSVA